MPNVSTVTVDTALFKQTSAHLALNNKFYIQLDRNAKDQQRTDIEVEGTASLYEIGSWFDSWYNGKDVLLGQASFKVTSDDNGSSLSFTKKGSPHTG